MTITSPILISSEVFIPKDHPSHPAVLNYCKNNLILQNPEYIRKLKNNDYIGSTPRSLVYYYTKHDNLVVPYGLIQLLAESGLLNNYTEDLTEYSPIDLNFYGTLLDYQKLCVDHMARQGCGVFTSPTGSGKTVMMAALIAKMKHKALVLVTTKDLLTQAKDSIEHFTNEEVGTITGGRINIQNITVATVQTMVKIDLKKFEKEWGVVVVDECHRITGSSSKTAMLYKILSNLKARHKFGCTATLKRADGLEKAVTFLVGPVNYEVSRADVGENMITPNYTKIDLNISYDIMKYTKTDGVIDYSKLVGYLANHVERNTAIANLAKERMENEGFVLILCDRVAQIKDIYNRIDSPDCLYLTGSSKVTDRMAAIEAARNMQCKCIVATTTLAGEGLDITVLNTLIWASLKKFDGTVQQAVGRISRKADNKLFGEPVVVYDIVDTDIGYCQHVYKQRQRAYKKLGMKEIKLCQEST